MEITVLDHVGYHGPSILLASSLYLLWEHRPYLIMYVLGMLLNLILNGSLKSIIKQARPEKQIEFIDHNNLKGINEYGMPSGHAQLSFYSIVYILCVKKPFKECLFVFVLLFIGILTCYQRVKFGRHTIEQVIVGSLIGSTFSYLIYRLTKKYLE
jgi:membrane-associated phospholipid phosphatase